jgi:hypothetical protein
MILAAVPAMVLLVASAIRVGMNASMTLNATRSIIHEIRLLAANFRITP